MDSFEKCRAYCVDIRTLVELVEASRREGKRDSRRIREIWTACLFTLCLESNEHKRFLIGFLQRGLPVGLVKLDRLSANDFGEIEDVDLILVRDFRPAGPSNREIIHQCQLVSYCYQSHPSSKDIIEFLEKKKLKKCPPDSDLRLIVHLEQQTDFTFDWVEISAHLQMRLPKCPYSQVFILARTEIGEEIRWLCRQVYPLMLPMQDMNLQDAKAILADRP